jgi:hypothetical protein
MSRAALTARERRLVALAILVAALALIVRGIIMPIGSGFSDRAETRRQLAIEYARNSRIIAASNRLVRTATRQKTELTAFALRAPDPAAGGIALQERLQAAVEAAGGEFRNAETRPGTGDQLRARLDASLTLPQLTTVMARLLNTAPYLTIEGFTLGADAALTSSSAGPLEVQIDVAIPFVAGR